MELMILIVKKIDMLMTSLEVRKMTVWAVRRVKMLMMTSKRKMMIALTVSSTEISIATSQTPETTPRATIIAQKLLILQEQQQQGPEVNNTRIDLPQDLPDLLQQDLLHQDHPETFLGGCLPVETLLDTLLDILTQKPKRKSGRQQW